MFRTLFIQLPAFSSEESTDLLAIGVLVLLILTVVFFIASLLTRYRHKSYENRLRASKDKLYPHIMNYLEGEVSLSHFKELFSGRSIEFRAFEKIIYELLTYIEGKDAEKLRRLLQVEPVYIYHCKLLDSFLFYNRIIAYNYFNYTRLEDDEIINKIKRDLHDRDQLIAFSAATALMASTDVATRSEALDATVRRRRISRMAILEMLYKFHGEVTDNLDREAAFLKRIISQTHYPPKNIGILIRGTSEIGYHQLPPFFKQKLNSSKSFWKHPAILSALIEAMGNFYHDEASADIRKHIYHEDTDVRRACAVALAKLPTSENLKALYNMLYDPAIGIKFRAVKALLYSDEEGKAWLRRAGEIDRRHPSPKLYIQPIIDRIKGDYGVIAV